MIFNSSNSCRGVRYYLATISFISVCRLVHRIFGWVGIALLITLVLVVNAFPNEKCEYPDIFGTILVPPENRLGEFRLALKPPDYDDPVAIRNHLVFSTIFARLLSSELLVQTRGFCEAVITPALFPDLRAYLIMNRSPGDKATDHSACTQPFERIAQTFQPNDQSIKSAAAAETARIVDRRENAGTDTMVAYNILTDALTRIYRVNTVMHTLISVDEQLYKFLDAASFTAWLRSQRIGTPIPIAALRMCASERSQHDLEVRPAPETRPSSSLARAAGIVELSNTRRGKSALPASLRHTIVVGDKNIIYQPTTNHVVDKYCNKKHNSHGDNGLAEAVTVRCLRQNLYGDAWMILFCDPKDCLSLEAAKSVAATLEKDTDIVLLASESSSSNQPRGPYIIDIEEQ